MTRANTTNNMLRGLGFALLCLVILPAFAQEAKDGFNDIDAADELQDISLLLANDDVDADALNTARAAASRVESTATACADDAGVSRTRLEERFEPLRDLSPEEASTESLSQRQSIRASLDEAIATQARCQGIADDARALVSRISSRQNELSQQFLSSRADSVFSLLAGLPERASNWPSQIREHLQLELVNNLTRTQLLWYLVIGGIAAAFAGLVIRRRFTQWYEAGGGDDMTPQMKYLGPKPLAEYAPLWLEGLVLYLILALAIVDASISFVVIRLAIAVFAFGLGCVIINWATGPLSPSAQIKGLIPDHVDPFRFRLRLFILAICLSYVVLGNDWLSIRSTQPYIGGRASMIFVVALGALAVLTYLRRIPGLQNRYRALRLAATGVTLVAIIALLAGYQNLAGYLVQGVTRTGIALFLLWILLWLFYIGFNYLLEQKTPTAEQVRSSLGMTGKGTGTGIGFMQLVADLVLWVAIIVYLIYVWDNTGSTLGKLQLTIAEGWNFGGVSLKPKNIVGGILVFALLVVVIGWIKRWVDRRWLQRIVIERGARDAILTLFGYIAFVLAILISLKAANVDLTGLAIISGALALGIGFGMQEIANNFVSGLILLFERPIRAGDFVTVGETEGFVRRIRIRATEIETLDNQNVLVPNSELVSGRVTNWVLRDTHGRLLVRVGVAYGSDVGRVREILETVANEHSEVISDGRAPAPRALFMGFGDSSLDFELRVRVFRIERRFSVMSDINFAIEKEFRKAGIVIPFPQRDLHIVSYPSADGQESAMTPKRRRKSTAPPEEITRSHSEELATQCTREEVWAALTDIEMLKRWLARDGSFEPNIGGRYSLNTRDGYTVEGRIDIFVPRRRLRVVTLSGEAEELPTGPITIELQLEDDDDDTHLTATVAGIPGSEDWEEYYRLSVDRWRTAFAELRNDVLRK